MEVVFTEGKYTAEPNQMLRRRRFGVIEGEKVELHPVEAGYLLLKNLATIRKDGREVSLEEFIEEESKDENFMPLFLVYVDLRERGKRVKPEDGFLYGDRIYFPISERREVSIQELYQIFEEKGEYILAVVDEESEITYYRVFEPELKGKAGEVKEKVRGFFAGDRVVAKSRELFEKFFYGSEKDGLVALSILEALYLAQKGILEVEKDLEEVAKKVERDFEERYELYRDLKERGMVVKTGFKFGSDFRVYDEIENVSQLPHSKYLISNVRGKMRLPEISRAVRLANSVRKKMVFSFRSKKERKYLILDRVKV
ncbi:MAG: tRNA-intron lyase [Archaeoglobus sp.]|nr:tRNA-intron lyase [Archaeoglobus sp.]